MNKYIRSMSEVDFTFFDNLAQRKAFPLVSSCITFLLYLCVAWFVLSPDAVWSPDTGAKLLQLQSLRLENGYLAYDIIYNERYLDTELVFAELATRFGVLSVSNNGLYFRRLPLFPLITLPFFNWFSFYGLYLLPAAGGGAINFFTIKLIQRKERHLAMWLLIAFGCPVFIYATLFWEHTVASGLVLASVWLAFRAVFTASMTLPSRLISWATTALLLALGTYLRLEIIIFVGAFLLACWLLLAGHRWYAVWSGLIYGMLLLPYRFLHNYLFTQPVPDNAAYLFRPATYLQVSRWQALPDLFVGPVTAESINHGWLGWLWSLAAVAALALIFFAPTSPVARRVQWTLLGLTALIALFFLYTPVPYRAAHGLLFTTPWALLGLCRAWELWSRVKPHMQVLILTAILGLIVYSVNIIGFRAGPPHGGLEWGARFAMTFYPLLALMAVWKPTPDWQTPLTSVIIFLLVILGLGFQIRGLTTIYYDKQINKQLNEIILATDQPVVSDIWWLRLNAAPIAAAKEIYLVDKPESVTKWVDLAASHSIGEFTFITLNRNPSNLLLHLLEDNKVVIVKSDRFGDFSVLRLQIE
jgi:hypothetical protein